MVNSVHHVLVIFPEVVTIFLVDLRFHSVENGGFGLGCDTK
jgi:hypothetical protein